MGLLLFFSILFFIYLIHSFYEKNRILHKKEVKGPIGFPIVGNMLQLGGKQPQIEMMKLEKQYNGNQGILRIFLGDYYSIILSDVSLIREVFVKNYKSFSIRPTSSLVRLGTNDYKGINGAYGECWLKNKRIVVEAMKRANTKNIYSLLDNQVDDLINEMSKFEKSGQFFTPKLYFRKFVLSTMYKYIFNDNVPYEENLENSKVSELTKEIENIFKSLKYGTLLNSISILKRPYYYYLKKSDKTFKNIKNLIIDKYSQHLLSFDSDHPKDLLDILINEYSKSNKDEKLHLDDILNITQVCLDMFMAGTDTTSNLLEWIVIKLCNNPEHQDIAYSELKKAVSNDKGVQDSITLNDRPNTPYIRAIVNETMRMHPVVALGLPRSCENDVTIGDGKYFIPKHSRVFINFHSIGYNEEYFKNCNLFNPSRFLGLTNSNEAFFPFGLGQRQCLGSQLASDQIYLCISNILLKYKLKRISKDKIDETGVFGLTISPLNYKVSLESR